MKHGTGGITNPAHEQIDPEEFDPQIAQISADVSSRLRKTATANRHDIDANQKCMSRSRSLLILSILFILSEI